MLATSAWAAKPDAATFAWAVERGDIKTVTAWLDDGLDPEFQTNQLGSGLMIAAWNGNIDMMKLFVARGANPRRANRNGEQPLQLAAWNGHTEALKWLLANGAAMNREGNYWGALHYAVFNGHEALAKYLIEQGADVNARSPNGSTPIILAAREGREGLAKTLLESGADTRLKNDWGDTPLTMAMRYDHYRLGKMISSPEEFEIAVKAPKESFGDANRSAAAPTEIEVLMQKIREAEAEGKPSEELHKQLLDAVNAFRRNAMSQKSARRPVPMPYIPRSIVITAKRGKPGEERAQVVTGGQAGSKEDKSSISIKPVDASAPPASHAAQAEVAAVMRQIRLQEAQGQPATELKQKLDGLLETLKKNP